MNNEILKDIIKNPVKFFRSVTSKFTPSSRSYILNNYREINKIDNIGEISLKLDCNSELYDTLLISYICLNKNITEKTSKKVQYDIAKRILKENNKNIGIFVFHEYKDTNILDSEKFKFRFSLVFTDYFESTRKFSSYKRFTYFIDSTETNHTFIQRIANSKFEDIESLKEAFSVEKVNKEFYNEIAKLFDNLLINNNYKFEYPKGDENARKNFIVRLLGRIIFCWFLKHKKNTNNENLISNKLLSSQAIAENYFHKKIEILFFEILNKPNPRIVTDEDFETVPYLNGGLFYPQEEDYYLINNQTGESIYKYQLNISENWFYDLFQVLERYNFTIDENLPFDQEVSVDPEMLGKIFENLLKRLNEGDKNDSIYTPREIVNYILDSCLIEYLASNTNIENPKISALVSYDLNDDLGYEFSQQEKIAVLEAIDELKILDLACGSGAFPIGLLQKLIFISNQIDLDGSIWIKIKLNKTPEIFRASLEKNFKLNSPDYIRKLEIIKNTIFGVDIQPIAVDIARLRCFLTLVVDANTMDPLPNLDFKFVCANSIINAPEINSPLIDSKENSKLEELISMYFGSSLVDKISIISLIRDEIDKIISINIKNINSMSIYKHDKRFSIERAALNKNEIRQNQRIVDLWNSYKNIFKNKPADFFDIKYFFPSVKEGFDIIIGNPPYIGEKGHTSIFDDVKKSEFGKRYYTGKMDYFYFFFHKGIDLLKDGGVLGFITTNYFITATGAKKLIHDFKERTTLLKLVNLNEYKIFESAKGQHNMITILKKGKFNRNVLTTITNRIGYLGNSIFESIVSGKDIQTKYYSIPQEEIYKDNSIKLTYNSVDKILDSLITNSYSLKEVATVSKGIETGANDIFIFDKYPSFFNELNIEEKSLFKPFYKNSDIKRFYVPESKNKYILYINNEFEITKNTQVINKYLEKHKTRLSSRSEIKDTQKKWFMLSRPRKNIIFDGEAIVTSYRPSNTSFAYKNFPFYSGTDTYYINDPKPPYSLKFILGVLNSSVSRIWFLTRGKLKGSILEMNGDNIEKCIIPKITDKNIHAANEIELLVEKIIILKKSNPKEDYSNLELEIDNLVYKLYDLSDQEISELESYK